MTRKDYELIARVLATLSSEESHNFYVDAFVMALTLDNPRFNANTFKEAANKIDNTPD